MRIIIGILLILILGFTGCEGRKTKSQALKAAVASFNKKVTIEIPVYKPATYAESSVDTVFSNGYRVKIKTYTDMENSVLFTKIKDTINYQTYYRNFKFNVFVQKKGRLIYNQHFDKHKIHEILQSNSTSMLEFEDFNDDLAILKSIELNRNNPNADHIEVDIIYSIPNTNKDALYTMIIFDNGTMNLQKQKL
jgi:hypothetical protein